MIFLGWNTAPCLPPALGWELFHWGLKPFTTLWGRVCRWVLFPGHSRNGNASPALSAPHSCPHTAAQEKLELDPGIGLAWKCPLPKGDPVLFAALEELSWSCPGGAEEDNRADGGTGLPKDSPKTPLQNRPAAPTVLPRAGPALRSLWWSVIHSKIVLLFFIITFSLGSQFIRRALTNHQRLCWGSGKLWCGWVAIRAAWRDESLFSHCSKEQLGLHFFPQFASTSEQPPAEEDDYGYARGIRWKQLWS